MTEEEYIKDYCKRCGKCDGSDYHRYHCTDEDIVEETWDAAIESVTTSEGMKEFLAAYREGLINDIWKVLYMAYNDDLPFDEERFKNVFCKDVHNKS